MANDFSGASGLIAHWRFESGANFLNDETANNNDWTDYGSITANGTYYKEGSYSAELAQSSPDYAQITDNSLSSTFPWKNNVSDGTHTVTMWVRLTSQNDEVMYIFGKDQSTDHGPRISTAYGGGGNDHYFELLIPTVNESITLNSKTITSENWTVDTWYFVAWTWDDTSQDVNWYIYEDGTGWWVGSGSAGYTDSSGTGVLNRNNKQLGLGRDYSSGTAEYPDMLIDELTVWNVELSASDIDSIRAGTYGATGDETVIVSSPLSLSFSIKAESVTSSTTVNAGTQTLTLTNLAETVTVEAETTVEVTAPLTLSFSTNQESIIVDYTHAPSAQSLTLSNLGEVVSADVSISVTAALGLTITQYAETVNITAGTTVIVSAPLSLSFSIKAESVLHDYLYDVGRNRLTNGDAETNTYTDSTVHALVGWTNVGSHNGTNKITIE